MATKVHSPTTNLFALLAEEQTSRPQAAKKAAQPVATKTAEQEQTPKARAEAKALQEAAERKKREANKAKQVETEQHQVEFDESGFAKQRIQRVKDKQLNSRTPVPAEKEKKQGEKKNDQKPFKRHDNNKQVGDKLAGDDNNRPFKERSPKPQGGYKPKQDGVEGGRPPRRDFDKQSAGKYSNKPFAKKQGSGGRGNWGAAVDNTQTGKPVEQENQEEASVADAIEGEAPVETTATTDETQPVADKVEDKKEDDEEEGSSKGLEDFLAQQEEKKKALEALVGGRPQPRELSDEEKSALGKFTLVENVKAKKATPQTAAKDKDSQAVKRDARKGEKTVTVDSVFAVQVAPVRGGRGGRGGKGRGRGDRQGNERDGQRDNNRDNNRGGNRGRGGRTPKATRVASTDMTQFPSLK